MIANKLTDNLLVSAQISVADIDAAAAQGVKVVVCNRPDHEEAGQITMDEIAKAAQSHGMKLVRYPVNPATFPGDDLAALGKIFDGSEGKVLAYCRTGTRSTNLWVLSRPAEERASAIETAQKAGYDLALFQKNAG